MRGSSIWLLYVRSFVIAKDAKKNFSYNLIWLILLKSTITNYIIALLTTIKTFHAMNCVLTGA